MTAAFTGDTVVVTWQPSTSDAGIDSYEISRSAVGGASLQAAQSARFTVPGTATRFEDTSIPTGPEGAGPWSYDVVAVDVEGNRSERSGGAVAHDTPPTPLTRISLQEAHLVVDGTGVDAVSPAVISWTATGDDDIVRYEVFRDGERIAGLGPQVTSFTDTELRRFDLPAGSCGDLVPFATYAVSSIDRRGQATSSVSVQALALISCEETGNG